MRKFALAGLTALLIPVQPSAAEPDFPREPGFASEERALIAALFTVVQPRSIAAATEYCGYLFRDAAGRLRVSGPVRGGEGGCNAPWPERGEPVASWHTHAGYDAGMWNEVPSARDMQADAFEGVDGWVATPGGRLWHVDSAAMVATLV